MSQVVQLFGQDKSATSLQLGWNLMVCVDRQKLFPAVFHAKKALLIIFYFDDSAASLRIIHTCLNMR